MASHEQIEANRQNAKKSKGPITESGKSVAKLNAVKHGLSSKNVVIPGEDPEEFEELRRQDISRSWLMGDAKPGDDQRRLYAAAHDQIQTNIGVLKPGMSFREVSEAAWKIPEDYLSLRYGSLIHGVGLADEYPSIKHWADFETKGYDGIVKPGMTLCVESFIGAEGGKEGVKLEEQVLITETGAECLSSYPYETDWL